MKKYYIGLFIILLFTFGFVGYTIYLGIGSKIDIETQKSAEEISRKLNNYVGNNKKIPESLSEVGVNDVPTTIVYTKLSDSKYKFCATYKSASGYYDYGVSGVLTGVMANNYTENYDDVYPSDYREPDLYVSKYHKKGENCTTVEPYLDNYNNFLYQSPLIGLEGEGTGSTNESNKKDNEREADINALHAQLEYFYATNGYYPTLENLNDSSWRNTNMNGLDSEALQDPDGSSAVLFGSNKKNAYIYIVKPLGCDNNASDCTAYELTATKNDGKEYSKNSLN